MKRHVVLSGETIVDASEPRLLEKVVTPSPLGRILLTGCEDALTHLDIVGMNGRIPTSTKIGPMMQSAIRELDEYFKEGRRKFTLPLHLVGTEFQLRVWRELTRVRYGEVASYGMIAEHLGRPRAVRAVGQACAANPIPIFIPCHRIVSSNGLGGFGLGVATKKWLLDHESAGIIPKVRRTED